MIQIPEITAFVQSALSMDHDTLVSAAYLAWFYIIANQGVKPARARARR